MMRLALVMIVALGTAACQPKTLNEMDYGELRATAHHLSQKCISQAGPENSPAWKQCMAIEGRAFNARSLQAKENIRNFGDGLAATGAGFNAGYNANRPMNCTSYRMGNYVNTNCY